MDTRTAAPSAAVVQRRTLRVVVLAQVVSGAGLAAGVTVGALLAEEMLGTTSLAGLAAAAMTVGAAATAVLVGRVSHRRGRRSGLVLGYVAGVLGSAGVVVAAVTGAAWLLFAALTVYGAGSATNLQARFAGTDLARPDHRGRAVSAVLVGTTAGAVAGPTLVGVTGRVAVGWGLPELSGPFLLAGAAYLAAAVVLAALLRPDPLLTARRLGETGPASAPATARFAPLRHGVLVGTGVMVTAQVVMVAVMTMTPVHMRDHGHGLGTTGAVLAVHVGAMYLPSPVTGVLVDRLGRRPLAVASGVVLLAAGLVAATAPPSSASLLALALGLLGLGWNLGLVSGTAMVTDAAPVSTRARTQGVVDLAAALAGAGGGALSGVVLDLAGYTALSFGGAVLGMLLVPVLAAGAVRGRRVAPAPIG